MRFSHENILTKSELPGYSLAIRRFFEIFPRNSTYCPRYKNSSRFFGTARSAVASSCYGPRGGNLDGCEGSARLGRLASVGGTARPRRRRGRRLSRRQLARGQWSRRRSRLGEGGGIGGSGLVGGGDGRGEGGGSAAAGSAAATRRRNGEEAGIYALTAPATLPSFGLPFLFRSCRAPSAPPPRPQPPSSLHLRCRCRCRWLCTFHVAATSPRCCRRRLRPLSTSQALPPPHPSL